MPLVCVHGWPETKRIFWRVIEPLAAAGFEVIVPDLRGFGDSDVGPDGFHDVPAHAHDLYALVHDELGHDRVVLVGGDLGGPVIQDLALRHPEWVDRMVLFNTPLPFLKDAMKDLPGTRPAREASDYFLRQGTDPDGLAAELTTPEQRQRYIATFYTSRFWAHPGAFRVEDGPERWRSTPSRSATRRSCGRASAATRARSIRAAQQRAERARPATTETPTLILLRHERPRDLPGVRPDGRSRVRRPRRPVPAARLRPLRAVGGAARARQRDRRLLQRPARVTDVA